MTAPTRRWMRQDYDRAAKEYHDSLPLEAFLEGVDQSSQRQVCSSGLEQLASLWPGFTFFNELLVRA